MARRQIGRVAWLVLVTGIVGVLLLAARVESPTSMPRNARVTDTIAALVTCVLPATADDTPPVSAGAPQMTTDCESSPPDDRRAPDAHHGAWITAC